MKTKILSILALLLAAVTQGAWAQEPATTYKVTVNDGNKDANNWTITSGQKTAKGDAGLDGLSENDPVTLTYSGRLKVKSVTATTDAIPWDGDLSKLTAQSSAAYAIATNGVTIKGTLAANVKVCIADGATVTLDGVTINGESNYKYQWAGLNCLGDATIVLKDGTTNTVTGFYENYPGIHVPAGSTLTIQGGTAGTGTLTASSNGWGAGIGGGLDMPCGNITITGGTVTATGGAQTAGIGSGSGGSCGNITIASTVKKVTATKGEDAPYSIGAGVAGTCGTVTIGGTKYWENNAAVGDGATYLAQATIVYPAPAGITAARAAYQGTNAPSQNWTKGDKLYVYGPGLELMGTLVADADGAEVFMAGTLDFTKTGSTAPMKLTLSTLPLPLDYRTQDGTQAKMTAYATATATATAIDAEAGTVTLDATPTLAPQQALVKLSLQDANGQPLSPSTLSLDAVDPNGGYSTVTKLRLDLPIDQEPTWAYGDYTYNNGAITLTNNCGVGWNTLSFSDVIVQCTGVIAVFEEGATGAGAITLQYLKNGETEPSYATNSFTQGQTWAWVGVPSDAKEIWGVFFSSGSDTTIKPTRITPNAIGDLTLSPNGSDVYVALKDVGTSNLTLRAKVGEKYYIYSGSVTFNEGNYYEQTVQMTEDD